MNEHEPSILKEPFIPLNDFSKPVLIIGDDKPESSDEDDGFKDIPSQMEFDSSSGIMDYNQYKQFYAEEIEGKFH